MMSGLAVSEQAQRRARAPAVAVVVFALVLAGLLVAKSSGSLHPPLSREQAKAASLRDSEVRAFLKHHGFDDVRALELDKTHWRVTFFHHGRTVMDASVGPTGRVDAVQPHPPGIHATGSNILWNRAVMVALAAIFIFVTAVVPLRRLRNLDALVVGGGLLGVLLLYDGRLVAADAYAGAAVIAYLGARCGWTAMHEPVADPAARPLYAAALQRLPSASRTRLATIAVAALLGAGALITVTSTGVSDVAFAGMAGATAIQRGDAPYGHITDEVVHGDTYPVLTYVLYLPFSLIGPVDDSFDNLDGALQLNALALVAAALLAFVLGARASRGYGLALAAAWLACPAVLLAASGGGNDVPTAALVVAGLALAARPVTGTIALALATAAKLGPAVALVAWVAVRRGRARAAAITATAGVGAACLALVVALGGSGAVSEMIDALAFQFRRGSFHSLWTQLGSSAAQAAFQAMVITLILVAVFLIATGAERPSFRRICALAAAGILGLQLAANYWTFAYFTWALPFILVALFPPAHPRSPQPAPPAP